MTGKVVIRCPAMPILATVRPWVRECQQLVCPKNEIVLENGTTIPFVLTFPKVLIHWQSPGHNEPARPNCGVPQDAGCLLALLDDP